MKFLSIDTTTNKLAVALSVDGKVFFRENEGAKSHNANILTLVEAVIDESGLSFDDIDCFCCVNGPGSFTGIRLGVSTINAFAQATKKPTFAINALDIVAYGQSNDSILALIDAGHCNYYGAEYQGDFKTKTAMGNYTQADVETFTGAKIIQSKDYDFDALIAVAEHTISTGKQDVLQPLYLKKSQAERIADGE